MLLLIDNYDSFTYNLAQYLGELGQKVRVERNDAIDLDTIEAMRPRRIVISPGPCTPNEAGISMDVIRRFAGEIPILGVCLGHQAIGQVFGGTIVRAGRIMHGKISKMFHDEQGLYQGVPNPFEATRYHSLIIDPASMPDCLMVTAKTWEDEIMGVRHRDYAGTAAPLEGVQFHPESIMTREGLKLLRNFLDISPTGVPRDPTGGPRDSPQSDPTTSVRSGDSSQSDHTMTSRTGSPTGVPRDSSQSDHTMTSRTGSRGAGDT